MRKINTPKSTTLPLKLGLNFSSSSSKVPTSIVYLAPSTSTEILGAQSTWIAPPSQHLLVERLQFDDLPLSFCQLGLLDDDGRFGLGHLIWIATSQPRLQVIKSAAMSVTKSSALDSRSLMRALISLTPHSNRRFPATRTSCRAAPPPPNS